MRCKDDLCDRSNGWTSSCGMIRDWGMTGGIMERVEQALSDVKGPQQHWGVSDTFGKYEG